MRSANTLIHRIIFVESASMLTLKGRAKQNFAVGAKTWRQNCVVERMEDNEEVK
jgi:hypothetical protein